jgi:hypothetical protein
MSTSALDGRRLGFVADGDCVTMNRERLMSDAKALALVTPAQTTAQAPGVIGQLTTAWTNQVVPVLAPMDQPTALAHCTTKYNDKLLMAQREEIAVDAAGTLAGSSPGPQHEAPLCANGRHSSYPHTEDKTLRN